ncbi:MAG: P-loop NTPase, partial [Solirubrobacteraceae bacterium]
TGLDPCSATSSRAWAKHSEERLLSIVQEPLDIVSALAIVRRRAWIVLLSIVAALAAASFVSGMQQRRFEATATLFVTGAAPATRASSVDPASSSLQLATLAQNSSTAYAQLAGSLTIASDAAALLQLPVSRLAGHIQGEAQTGVQLVHVRADAPTGAESARFANAAAAALAARAPGLADKTSGGLRLDVVDPAQAPTRPVSPNTKLNLVLGGLVGLLLGLGLASVRERLDRRIRSDADAAEALGLPLLGELPRITRRLRSLGAVDRHAILRVADPYRRLASSVAVASKSSDYRRILITSPAPKEGKSTVAAHLALSLAQDGQGTVLLDCDLHRPTQHGAFPDAPSYGDVLEGTNGSLPASTQIQPCLRIVAAGAIESEGSLGVRGPEFLSAITASSAEHDWVLLDSPPVLSTADVGALALHSDAAILVIAAGRTREDDALAALAALNRLGVTVLGVVLFGVRPRRHLDYYGGRG